MKSSHESNEAMDSPAHNMLRLLNELLNLKPTASNGAKISKKLAELQTTYHSMDETSRTIIHDQLLIQHKELVDALEKKGSKIIKPLKLAEHISRDLPSQLEQIIAENPATFKVRLTAIPTHPLAESDEFIMPADTVRVKDSTDDQGQYQHAVQRMAEHQDPASYIANIIYGADDKEPVDPLTACVNALEIMRKSRLNYLKILSDETKPVNFDATYRDAMLKQIHALHKHRQLLKQFQVDDNSTACLDAIRIRLNQARTNEPDKMLKLAEAIGALVNEQIIKALSSSLEQATPRPKSNN